jgi:hypothetical protein
MNEFSKKYQYSKNEFSKKHQYSKNEFSKKHQYSKNEFSKIGTVRTSSVRNISIQQDQVW